MVDLSDYLGDGLDDGRVGIDLSCRVIAGDDVFPATLSDLSHGGACITAQDAPDFTGNSLKSLDIDGLGRLDVIYRWRRGARIGVSFLRDHDARPRIDAFLAERGLSVGARS